MRLIQKNSLRFLSFVTALELLLVPLAPVQAGLFSSGISVPSASSMASDIERRYNLDVGALRDQGQSFNVANQKKVTPEVSIHFSPSDPKVGEKLTASAMPIYFSNPDSDLYFTWYLKHRGCDLKAAPITATESANCDRDRDGRITVEDWKIEAMRIIASNEFDAPAIYPADTDNDGYKARYGGDTKVDTPDHCYYHDNVTGTNYELADRDRSVSFSCTGGRQPVCMIGKDTIEPGECEVTGGTGGSGGSSGSGGSGGDGGNASCDTFVEGTDGLTVAGLPICNSSGAAECYVGGACCVNNPLTATTCEQSLIACSGAGGSSTAYCRHLFPNAPGGTTGNGVFGREEEQFWRTDPTDPDTADNGNKDEANVAGLGQARFRWNYAEGDLVGVVVEGTSMITTKHDDSSSMIMWAFSKNDCPMSLADGSGSYSKRIRNYPVIFPTVDFDLNKCLERNLVDPVQGGQATNLEVNVTATPDNPQNDGQNRNEGDVIEAVATIDNSAKDLTETLFDWRVELSSDGTNNPPSWVNVTSVLNSFPDGRKLLSEVRGSGVNALRLKLDLRDADQIAGRAFATYLTGNIGHLRFRVDVRENFNSTGALRKGNSSVIVKFSSAADKIRASLVTVVGNPSRVTIPPDQEICSGSFNPGDTVAKQALDKLEAKVCRVLKNEIIGLTLPNPGNVYSNFNWSINSKSLVCNTKVSPSCFDDRQTNTNFFPVVGNPGDLITISLTANKIDLTTSTEKTVELTRAFRIVEPAVEIVSADLSNVWPKVLGQYVDANGTPFPELSKDTLQALSGAPVALKANFIPNFLGGTVPPRVERGWKVDDVPIGDAASNQVNFTTSKPEGSIYNIRLDAVYRPGEPIRKALSDIWGISVLDAPEQYFGTALQLENPPGSSLARKTGAERYLALVSNYLPASVLFSLRVLLSIALILFISGAIFSLTPGAMTSRRS